jgi:hypothetical protein
MHSAITTATKNQAARPTGTHHHAFTFPPVVTGLCNQVLLRTVTLECHIVGISPEPPWIRLKPWAQCGSRGWNGPEAALERRVKPQLTH